jgi:hypothetical protein
MRIITANWMHVRVSCDCGNEIAATLSALKVKCKCGRWAYMSELQDKKLAEKKPDGKLDRYLA